MSDYLPHQVATSDEVLHALRLRGVVLLAGEMRTGKTRTAIRVAELSKAADILIITKKAAIPGWLSELDAVSHTKNYTVTNYEQASKLSNGHNLVIIDESHAIGRAGKPTKRFRELRRLAHNKPVLLLSGTPAVETHLAYYYQFGVTHYSPFDAHKNFYEFFRQYGKPNLMRMHGRMVETYTQSRPELLETLKQYIITLTQAQAGIKHTARDVVHKVPLTDHTRRLIKTIRAEKVATINGVEIAFESEIKERLAVHQIETGALLIDDQYTLLGNTEIVDYLLATFGDTADVALMCHFKSTRLKLAQHFKHAQLFSSVAHAEGVDLSHFKHFVIVNTCYSGAKHIQRRDRVVNLKRGTEALVHHIVAEGGISHAVYKAVSRKRDFNLATYRRLNE